MSEKDRIDKLESDVLAINEKLDLILASMSRQNEVSEKLDTHIDLIERVYTSISGPMYWAVNKISNSGLYKKEGLITVN